MTDNDNDVFKMDQVNLNKAEWDRIPSVVFQSIQSLKMSQNHVQSYLNKQQIPEKFKIVYRNLEKIRMYYDEQAQKTALDFQKQKLEFQLEYQKISDQINLLRMDDKLLYVILKINKFLFKQQLVIPEIQIYQNYENFEYNMLSFVKYYQEPMKSEKLIDYTQYINSKNIWRIINTFVHECHLQDSVNNLKEEIKELNEKVYVKEEQQNKIIENIHRKLIEIEQIQLNQQSDLSRVLNQDFDQIQNKLDKSLFEIEDLKTAKMMMKEIKKEVNSKLKENCKELRSITQQFSSIQNQLDIQLEMNLARIQKDIVLQLDKGVTMEKLAENTKMIIDQMQINYKKQEIQYKNDIAQFEKNQNKLQNDIKTQNDKLNSLSQDLKQGKWIETTQFQNSIHDVFARLGNFQKDVSLLDSYINNVVQFKNTEFSDNFNQKVMLHTKNLGKKFEKYEIAIEKIMNMSKNQNLMSQDDSQHISKKYQTEPDLIQTQNDNIEIVEKNDKKPLTNNAVTTNTFCKKEISNNYFQSPKNDYRFLKYKNSEFKKQQKNINLGNSKIKQDQFFYKSLNNYTQNFGLSDSDLNHSYRYRSNSQQNKKSNEQYQNHFILKKRIKKKSQQNQINQLQKKLEFDKDKNNTSLDISDNGIKNQQINSQ